MTERFACAVAGIALIVSLSAFAAEGGRYWWALALDAWTAAVITVMAVTA